MHLVLIFTEGVSLRTWHHSGLIVRDSLLYERLCEKGHQVTFVTYGKPDDHKYLPAGSRIRVLSRPAGMSVVSYGRLLPFIHYHGLRRVDLVKAHQLKGGRYAAWTSLVLRKPFIARCGYLPSVFLRNEGAPRAQQKRIEREERLTFRRAAAAFVPGETEKAYVGDHYGVSPSRIHLMPNWVDTEKFSPESGRESPLRKVCFVGRFTAQKQPLKLVEAMKGISDAELVMIGGGEMKPEIEACITAHGIKATLFDRIENDELPRHLQACAVYVLPTLHEGGSPKTLLEAMACGVPVVSTNAFGVDDAFEDGRHGLKVSPHSVEQLRDAISWILDHPEEGRAMGARARTHVISQFSIDRAVEREIEVYRSLLREKGKPGSF